MKSENTEFLEDIQGSRNMMAADARGRTKYFHGRKDILNKFRSDMVEVVQTGGGTCTLIQGVPGTGKTALLDECTKQAQIRGWHTVSTKCMVSATSRKAPRRSGRDIPGEAFNPFFTFNRTASSSLDMLGGRDAPLLITIDEGRTLSYHGISNPDERAEMVSLVNSIHQGRIGRPVILMAAGTGDVLPWIPCGRD